MHFTTPLAPFVKPSSTSTFAVITTIIPTATVKDFIKLPVFWQSSGRDLISFWHSLAGMFAETTLCWHGIIFSSPLLLAFDSKFCHYVDSHTGSRQTDEEHPSDKSPVSHSTIHVCNLFLSSSVMSFSRSWFSKCAKSRSSFCLMISTNSYILKSSFHMFRA